MRRLSLSVVLLTILWAGPAAAQGDLVSELGAFLGQPSSAAGAAIEAKGYKLTSPIGCEYVSPNQSGKITLQVVGGKSVSRMASVEERNAANRCTAVGKRVKTITFGTLSRSGEISVDAELSSFQGEFGKADTCAPIRGGTSCTWNAPQHLPRAKRMIMTARQSQVGASLSWVLDASEASLAAAGEMPEVATQPSDSSSASGPDQFDPVPAPQDCPKTSSNPGERQRMSACRIVAAKMRGANLDYHRCVYTDAKHASTDREVQEVQEECQKRYGRPYGAPR